MAPSLRSFQRLCLSSGVRCSDLACRVSLCYGSRMGETKYTALLKRSGDWWIGWVQEIPGVNAQERTKEELVTSLRKALREAIDFNREDASKAADSDYIEEPIAP